MPLHFFSKCISSRQPSGANTPRKSWQRQALAPTFQGASREVKIDNHNSFESYSIFPPPELTKRTRMTRAIFKAVWFLGGGRWGILNATVLSHCKVVTSFFTEPVLIFLYFQLDLELGKIGSWHFISCFVTFMEGWITGVPYFTIFSDIIFATWFYLSRKNHASSESTCYNRCIWRNNTGSFNTSLFGWVVPLLFRPCELQAVGL